MTERPLFPEGAGEVIHAILNLDTEAPSGGPPYTHTFRYPPTEMAAFDAGMRALLDAPGLCTDEVERLKIAIQDLAAAMRRPVPNPAFRDYHRRTKHRRRRTRR